MTSPSLTTLLSLLSPFEILDSSSSNFSNETSTWAAQKNQHPEFIVRPSSVETLAKVLSHACATDVDFAIYGSGNGSASARDVLISMAAFDEFDFDKEKKILTIGAGQLWRDYYEKMEKVAPDYHGGWTFPPIARCTA